MSPRGPGFKDPRTALANADSALPCLATFDTQALPLAERFRIWRACFRPVVHPVPDPAVDMTGFSASVQGLGLGPLALFHTRASPHYLRRQPWRNTETKLAPLLVVLCEAGGYAGYNGNQRVSVEAGDVGLLDLGQGMDLHLRETRALTVVIPPCAVPDSPRATIRFNRSVHVGSTVPGAVLADFLHSVWRQLLASMDARRDPVLRRMLVQEVVSAFATPRHDVNTAAVLARRERFLVIQAYIDERLAERLKVGEILRHFKCSHSTLYRLFQAFGGVGNYIRRARLNRCLEELSGVRGPPSSVTHVCLRYGFAGSSHFSHRFREAFGATPSQALRTGRLTWQERHPSRSSTHRATHPRLRRSVNPPD